MTKYILGGSILGLVVWCCGGVVGHDRCLLIETITGTGRPRSVVRLGSRPLLDDQPKPLEAKHGVKRVGAEPARTHTTFTANVSAYCPDECCTGIYADGITASGHVIQPGDKFVAAPKHIPFGTMIDIPGYGRVPVLDRGGAIKGNKLDVYFPDHNSALQWGRQSLTVTKEVYDE